MAFKRRGTGRDEMLKRNMERLAQRRRARATKPEPKKEDLKVGTKEPANPMVGMGPYKDGSVYASALAKAKAKLASSGNNIKPQTNPVTKEELQTPETQNQNVPPPAETRKEPEDVKEPETPVETAPKEPETPSDSGTQPETSPVSNNEEKIDLATMRPSAALTGLLNSLRKQLAKSTVNQSQGIRIGLKNRAGKFWAGSKYGFQSEASYKKLKAAGKI